MYLAKHENEAFTRGICNFRYSWTSSDPDVLQIHTLTQKIVTIFFSSYNCLFSEATSG